MLCYFRSCGEEEEEDEEGGEEEGGASIHVKSIRLNSDTFTVLSIFGFL
jgi:hypothetical protein